MISRVVGGWPFSGKAVLVVSLGHDPPQTSLLLAIKVAPQTALGRRPGRAGFHGGDVAMLEEIKRTTEVDADVIGDRLSAVENIRGQIIGIWSGGGRCIDDRRRRTPRNRGGRWIADRGRRIVMTNCRNGGGRSKRCGAVAHRSLRFKMNRKHFNQFRISGKGRLAVFRQATVQGADYAGSIGGGALMTASQCCRKSTAS
jgi:hypothetical protein